jgi:hypothetical protein
MTTAAAINFLKLLLNNIDWPNIGDAGGLQNSAAAGNLYLSLHTAAPGVGGSQSTNETSYTGYARQAVPRDGTFFDTAADPTETLSDVSFGLCTAGAPTITHWGIGTDNAGAGNLIAYGTLTPNIAVAPGVNPKLLAGSTIDAS